MSIAIAGAAFAGTPTSPFAVLVLHSSYRGYPWTDAQEQGIVETLGHLTPHPDVTNEYLDLYRHPDARYYHGLLQLFRVKYPQRHFDVIICTDDPALQFMLDYRETLFPHTPVTFCGINNFKDSLIAGHSLYTGVSETIDVRSTLKAALALQPDTRNVTVIGDHAGYYYANREMLQAVIPEFTRRVQFTYIEGMPLDTLLPRLRTLPPHTMLLLLAQLRNARGEMLPSEAAVQRLSAASPFPVYTCWDFFLGNGVMGGRVISGYSQGVVAAEKAIRILQGMPVSAIPVQKVSPSQFIFDYQALQRFHIPTTRLPAGSVLLRRPRNWYPMDKELVWAGSTLLMLLAGIALYLFLTIRRRLRAEEQLRATNHMLTTLIDASPLSIIAIDAGLHVTEWNPAAARLFGWDKSEALGRPSPIVPPGEEIFLPASETMTARKGFTNIETRRCCKDGRLLDVLLSVAPLFDGCGNHGGYVSMLVDITERKRMEEQGRLLLLMQEKERMHSDLLSRVSHELKTPLTPIIAGLELLDDEEYTWTDKRQHIIQIMRRQAKRQLYLINDLLYLSGMERDEFTMRCETADLAQLAQQSLDSFLPVLLERGLSGQFSCTTQETLVYGDPTRLAQVLDNLVNNAVKYTKHGGITVGVFSREAMVQVEVSDTGIGLAATDVQQVFQRFFQVDPDQPGAGLGLAIARQLVEAQGGSMWAESSGLGHGSTFVFCIPKDDMDHGDIERNDEAEASLLPAASRAPSPAGRG